MEWSSNGVITLVIPAFSAIESRNSWQWKMKQRRDLHARLQSEIQDLSRSRTLQDLSDESGALMSALVDRAEADRTRLEQTLASIQRHGLFEPTTQQTVEEALKHEQNLGLSPQDATVYAAVLQHLKRQEARSKVFVTRNSNDFANPSIEDELEGHDCKLLRRFGDAVGYIRSRL